MLGMLAKPKASCHDRTSPTSGRVKNSVVGKRPITTPPSASASPEPTKLAAVTVLVASAILPGRK